MDAGMITERREKKRMKEGAASKKQSLNTEEIDVLMKGGEGGFKWEGKAPEERKEQHDRPQQIKLSALLQTICRTGRQLQPVPDAHRGWPVVG